MSKRVCPTPGCPSLTDGGPCDEHRRQREQARGSSTARGYDYQHQQDRKRWAPAVESGKVRCRRCDELIHPLEAWDLGHDESRRVTHPEHASCNRATASHKGGG